MLLFCFRCLEDVEWKISTPLGKYIFFMWFRVHITFLQMPHAPPHLRNRRTQRGKSFFWLWKSTKLSRNPCHWVQSHSIHGTGIFTINYLHIGWIHCGKCRCIYIIHGSYGNCHQVVFQKCCSLLRFWYPRKKERPRAGVRKNTLVGVD